MIVWNIQDYGYFYENGVLFPDGCGSVSLPLHKCYRYPDKYPNIKYLDATTQYQYKIG